MLMKTESKPDTKPLASTFTDRGWNHTQLKRTGEWAIYERSKPEGLPPHHEVVRIRWKEARMVGGREIPEGEHYPSSSRWGVDGFTLRDLEDAERCFAEKLQPPPGVAEKRG